MRLQLSIVCENTVGRPIPACGEHGFACFLRGSFGNWLFDTGSGSTLLDNLNTLDIDPQSIDGVILSHGHYDHCGGLMPLLKEVGSRRVVAHPEIFRERFWQGQHEERNISMQYPREELEEKGAQFDFHAELATVAPGLYFSGKIERTCTLEEGDPQLVCRN
jgi:7,8-dihydropterin-6-yl-methyl-4-(beta-D-ribofuranosyl)aminobenzene 5'-phosphate synthase